MAGLSGETQSQVRSCDISQNSRTDEDTGAKC